MLSGNPNMIHSSKLLCFLILKCVSFFPVCLESPKLMKKMLQIITFVIKVPYTTIFDFHVFQRFIAWYNPMYNSILKTLQLSVSAYLKGNFKNSSPYRHFGMIETCIYCAPLLILLGVCFSVYLLYANRNLYMLFWLLMCILFPFTFNLMSSLCIGAILLKLLSLHNHCFGIHLCIIVVCRCYIYMVFLFQFVMHQRFTFFI